MERLAGQNRERSEFARETLSAVLLDGVRREIPEEDFHRIDLAYSITADKAQGSQFKRVIMPVVRSRLLERTLVYTALTRGIEQVVFIGDRDAFDAAVIAPPRSYERQGGVLHLNQGSAMSFLFRNQLAWSS